MSNFLETAKESLMTKNKAEELEGRADDEGDGVSVRTREFFWDNVVLFVVSSILGLAAIDVITEFIRGGSVACYAEDNDLSDSQQSYINNFCSGSLPVGAYLPVFIVVHGVLIAIPHYLWLNHYGGNFSFFFHLVSSLKRLRDETTGEYDNQNHIVVQQLHSAFATYGRNTIFILYVSKLAIQLLWALVGLVFVAIFFTNFDATFVCPEGFDNATTHQFWPFDNTVVCVFDTLRLLRIMWFAELCLLLLVVLGLAWALIWCVSIHTTELGSKEVALFSFRSGLAPEYYVPSIPVPNFCKKFFTSVPWISFYGPRIKSDLDFLVMKLYRTDSGLGHVFKDVQILMELKHLIDDDQRRLSLHSKTHSSIVAENTTSREWDHHISEADDRDLKWGFEKKKDEDGVYREFEQIPSGRALALTDTMRGTVLGFAARAPDNGSAIDITFGNTGYATALARVFKWVTSLNFSPFYKNSEEALSIQYYYTNIVSMVCAEDILSTGTQDRNEFDKKIKAIWVPPNRHTFLPTSYVVIGPIDRDKGYHHTTVDLFLETIAGCLEEGALILTIRPVEIAGKDVRKEFSHYEPPKPLFIPLEHHIASDRSQIREWEARESFLETSQQQQQQQQTTAQGASLQILPLLPDKQSMFALGVNSTNLVEFYTYQYVGGVERPGRYKPTPPPSRRAQPEKGDGDKGAREKNTNLQQQ